MAGDTRSVYTTLEFGREKYLLRQVPIAVGLAALGALMLYLLHGDSYAKFGPWLAAYILIIAGVGCTLFAIWRWMYPAEPVLVLSPAGIRYHLASGLRLTIPWGEIEGVDSTDIRIWHRGFYTTYRDVTVALISDRAYRARVKPETWWHRGRAWKYHFIPKDGGVQVALFHDVLSVPADELRDAVEDRWRAFSRHPNAKLPPRPRVPSKPRFFTRGRKQAVALIVVGLTMPLIWYWNWVYARLVHNVPDGVAHYYVIDQLNRRSVPARTLDGRMVALRFWHVSSIGPSRCHKDIVQLPQSQTWRPVYDTTVYCIADLVLTSGGTATGIIKLVVDTFDMEAQLGKITQGRAIVAAEFPLDEAERRLCALTPCGAGAGRL